MKKHLFTPTPASTRKIYPKSSCPGKPVAISELTKDQYMLVDELVSLLTGLKKCSNVLLIKKHHMLECQFMRDGFMCHQVLVKTKELVEALQRACPLGLLEGTTLGAFKNTYTQLALHVKTKVLYLSLKNRTPHNLRAHHNLLVA